MVHVLAVRCVELHVISLRLERRAGFNSLRFRFHLRHLSQVRGKHFRPQGGGRFQTVLEQPGLGALQETDVSVAGTDAATC
jgi:hypothetical protein